MMSKKEFNTGMTAQRFTTATQPRNSSTQNSKDAEAPMTLLADVYRIIRDLVLFFCRRIIFGPAKFKLIVSFTIIVIGSFLRSWELAPTSYFSLKTNFLNRYFAKLGWAWTLGLLIPFVYLTLIATYNQYQIFTRHLSRLVIATGIWYITTMFFVRLEEYTGSCKHVDMQGVSREVCLRKGHQWQEGTDFSGHTFLLLYSLLIINEEVKSYDNGTRRVDQAARTTQNESGDTSVNNEHERLKMASKVIRILYVCLAGLTILWEFMLLSTALYFHHTLHKLAAALVAVFFWYITYYLWYRTDSPSLLYPLSP